MKFYKRWIGDYTRKTRTLTATEHGVYTLMLDYAYSTEEPLPLDEDDLRVLCSAYTEAERAAIPKVLAKFWRETPEGWVNDRVEEVLGEAAEFSRAQSERGKKGGRPRKARDESPKEPGENPEKSGGFSPAKTEESRNEASHSQTPEPDKKKDSNSVDDADFEAWWQHVPRKVAKGQARKAYRAARKKADADTLLAGIKRYAEAVRGKDAQYIRHPATWLNGEGWLDEAEPAPPKPQRPKYSWQTESAA